MAHLHGSFENPEMVSKYQQITGSLCKFLALVIILSIPFWVLGGLTGIQLLPGLPIDAFMVVCPALAALVLTAKENGKPGVIRLIKRGLDYKNVKAKSWYFITVLFMPLVSMIVFIWLRLSGVAVPSPRFSILQLLIFIAVFFLGALCEELGWTGYLIELVQSRLGALNTGLVIGLFSIAYHLVALIQVQRSFDWILWWSISTLAQRVIIVWLYNNTGKSVFAASLFHMTINLTWQLFPVKGSYYSPFKTGVVLLIATVLIVLFYGPTKLSRQNY